ncbi:MAG: halocyanin domain-containing protein [Salinirussus sp.]
MTDSRAALSRRGFLAAAAGTGATAATGTAAAAESEGGSSGGGGKPDFGGWLDPVTNFDSTADRTGQSEATVEVGVEQGGGPYGFGPAAIHVDNGATVKWKWIGEGGQHNVVHTEGGFESDLFSEPGTHYERTFEEDGIYNYYCRPHKSLGMKGAVVVGTDYPTKSTGGGTGGPQPLPDSAKTLGVATGFVMIGTLGLAYFFMKYGGDYGDFEDG